MMKVYLVTRGYDYEYSVDGIFSSPEKAEAYIAELQKEWPRDQFVIKTFTVDDPDAEEAA